MQAVVNPLTLPAILKQAAITQLREVTGYLWLAFIQCTGQLTNTQLFLSGDKQHQPDTSFISQAFENGGWSKVVGHRVSALSFLGIRIKWLMGLPAPSNP